MKKLKRVFLLGLALLSLAGCQEKTSGEKTEETQMQVEGQEAEDTIKVEATDGLNKYSNYFFDSFDTVTQTAVFAETDEEGYKYSKHIKDRMADLHKEFSSFDAYEGVNNVYTINDQAGKEPVQVSDELFDLIESALADYKNYSHKNDISFGRVTEIWRKAMDIYGEEGHDQSDNKALPSLEELKAADSFTNIDSIVLDKEKKTVFISDPKTKLDVGSVAKGYAVELVARELEEMGANSVLISAGGNVRAIGGPSNGKRDNWAVGVQNPQARGQDGSDSIKEILYINGKSVVTSGDYERYFTVDGKNYHHIIDIDTLYPADHFRSLTIVTESSALADFLSTAVFCMDVKEGFDLINSIDGVEGFWILKDGTTVHTPGMEAYMESMGASPVN